MPHKARKYGCGAMRSGKPRTKPKNWNGYQKNGKSENYMKDKTRCLNIKFERTNRTQSKRTGQLFPPPPPQKGKIIKKKTKKKVI